MDGDPCRLCGGDGRIGNALAGGGSSARCPGCHGTGRRAESAATFRDVTKTKPSHHQPAVVAKGPRIPTTPEGLQLAAEVRASALPEDGKTRLIAEIVQHEATHARCTRTFVKKVRKQTAS